MQASRQQDESSGDDRKPKRRRTSPQALPAMSGKPPGNAGARPAGSFAARMMAKMGHVEGQGLGADGRGRLAPIETQLRPQGAGLGAVKEKTKQAKEEEKREAAFRGQVLQDSSEEEKEKRRRARKKLDPNAKTLKPVARTKPRFKTVSEIEEAADGLKVPDVLKSIIDATGSENRLLDSTAGLMSQGNFVQNESEEAKFARKAKRDVTVFSDEWMSLKEREEYYANEGVELSNSVSQERQTVMEDNSMLAMVQDLQNMTIGAPGPFSTWDDVVGKLKALEAISMQDDESVMCHEISVAAIFPLFKRAMSSWDPLKDPVGVVPHLESLRLVLGVQATSADTTIAIERDILNPIMPKRSTTYYETMIYTFWLPPVRTAITKDWDVRDPAPLLRIVEAWKTVLPPFILANVIDQLVVKRLTDAVAAWNPIKSRRNNNHTQPPHVWLFPWLQYLDDQHTDAKNPTGLMSDVKRKFKSVLSSWNLSQGLIPGLDEWKSVFPSDLSSMLVRYLLPRFRPHLADFEVNPREQDETFGILEDVLQWAPLFSLSTIAEVIKLEFFPKWHQSLFIWLTTPAVNYDEVGQWYQWWKGVFEERLSTDFNELTTIAAEWERGLQLMLEASELGPEASSQLEPPILADEKPKSPHNDGQPQIQAAPVPKPPAALETPTTFKDVLEEWCSEQGLHLVPLREADVQTGLPLFRITASASFKGGVVVYLKGDVVWVRGSASVGGQRTFAPIGLDDTLVLRAEGK